MRQLASKAALAAIVLAAGLMTERGRAGHQDRRHPAADRRVRGVGQLRRQRREDRRRRDQRQGRRARQEDRAGDRGQQEQSDRSRRRRREAHRARQGAGDDGRVGLELHARGHAEADGIQGADAGRDLVGRQDHHVGQSVRLPHLAAVGGRGGRLRQDRRSRSRSERPISWSSTTTGAAAPPKTSARC